MDRFQEQRLNGIDARYRRSNEAYHQARDRVRAIEADYQRNPDTLDRQALLRELRLAIESLESALGAARHAAIFYEDSPVGAEKIDDLIMGTLTGFTDMYSYFDPWGPYGISLDEL